MANFKNTDFHKLASSEKNARMQLRLKALAHFQDGKSKADIARFLKVSRTSVTRWISDYLKYGINGLIEHPRSGRPCQLNKAQLQQLTNYISEHAKKTTGGRLNGMKVQAYITAHFGTEYKLSNIYRLMHELGFSWITSRSKHPKQSEEVQQEFKKNNI